MEPSFNRLRFALLAAVLTSFLLTAAFHSLVSLAPPAETAGIAFPSGLAAVAFSIATVVSLTYRRAWLWAITWTMAGLVSACGNADMLDLVGGAVLGAACGAASYGLLMPGASEESAGWRWLLWPQIALVILATLMAYLGYLPRELLRWPYADKVLHFLLFGAVTFWLNFWLRPASASTRSSLLSAAPLAILIPFAIAALEEGVQSFSPLRTADWSDLASDLAGMVVFWGLSRRLQ